MFTHSLPSTHVYFTAPYGQFGYYRLVATPPPFITRFVSQLVALFLLPDPFPHLPFPTFTLCVVDSLFVVRVYYFTTITFPHEFGSTRLPFIIVIAWIRHTCFQFISTHTILCGCRYLTRLLPTFTLPVAGTCLPHPVVYPQPVWVTRLHVDSVFVVCYPPHQVTPCTHIPFVAGWPSVVPRFTPFFEHVKFLIL